LEKHTIIIRRYNYSRCSRGLRLNGNSTLLTVIASPTKQLSIDANSCNVNGVINVEFGHVANKRDVNWFRVISEIKNDIVFLNNYLIYVMWKIRFALIYIWCDEDTDTKYMNAKYMNVLLNKKEYDTIFTLCVVFFKNVPVSKSFQAFPMPLLKQNGE